MSRYRAMTPLNTDDKFPTSVVLKYIPYSNKNKDITACANPIDYDLSKELPNRKVVITSAIGAFTRPCTEEHIPTYLKHINDFKKKGIDQIVILTSNDAFVNSAWGKALGYRDEDNYVIFASDPNAQLSAALGDNFVADMSSLGIGLGIRTNRYAAIVVDGQVQYLESEEGGEFTDRTDALSLLERL